MDQRRKFIACFAAHAVMLVLITVINKFSSRHATVPREPSVLRRLSRASHLCRILRGETDNCVSYLRMNADAFINLAQILRNNHLLKDTKYVLVEEQLACFLHIVGHSRTNRAMRIDFIRSGRTVHRCFRRVLTAICKLKNGYIIQATSNEHPRIQANPNWYPYFKDCIGLMDGTHILARVPADLTARFRGRKGVTQNVLGCCDPDMRFTYILAGWEGSANDFTVLKDALSRPSASRLNVPQGKYYLVDAGYTTMSGFLAPYRGVRYHLKEIIGRKPENSQELFNFRHSSLRSTIERAFALLKGRFRMIHQYPYYPFPVQVNVVLACCVLHNYILSMDRNDMILNDSRIYEEYEYDLQNFSTKSQHEQRLENTKWQELRDKIAKDMWHDYSKDL